MTEDSITDREALARIQQHLDALPSDLHTSGELPDRVRTLAARATIGTEALASAYAHNEALRSQIAELRVERARAEVPSFWGVLKRLARDPRIITTVAGLVVALAGRFGLQMSAEEVAAILGTVMVAVGGVAAKDAKDAAQAKREATTHV